jgi:hypothetical protein
MGMLYTKQKRYCIGKPLQIENDFQDYLNVYRLYEDKDQPAIFTQNTKTIKQTKLLRSGPNRDLQNILPK